MDASNWIRGFLFVFCAVFISQAEAAPLDQNSLTNIQLDNKLPALLTKPIFGNPEFLQLGKNISPLKYRQVFKIAVPLKPKSLKYVHRPLLKLNNQSFKRDTSKHSHHYQNKHVPFLRSLGNLFNNMLPTTPNTPLATEPNPIENTTTCQFCDTRANDDMEGGNSFIVEHHVLRGAVELGEDTTATNGETNNYTSLATTEVSPDQEITTAAADNTTTGDVSGVTQDTHLSAISAGDPAHSRGSGGRHTEGSGAPCDASHNGNITGCNGDSEHVPQLQEVGLHAKSIQEDTTGDSRVRSDGSGTGGGRGDSRITGNSSSQLTNGEDTTDNQNTTTEVGGDIGEPEIQNKIQNKGIETKESVHTTAGDEQRLRGALPTNKVHTVAKPLQPKGLNAEGFLGLAQRGPGDQRLASGSGPVAQNDQEIHSRKGEKVLIIDDPILNRNSNKTENVNPIEINSGYSHYNLERSGHVNEMNDESTTIDSTAVEII